MNFNIAIIGVGNLGRRHLESLVRLKYRSNIYVIDPNQQSLEASKIHYDSALNEHESIHLVRYSTFINDLPKDLDFVIVATNSNVRENVIEELISKVKIKYFILEKFLFPEMKSYNNIQTLIEKNNVKCWVNCGRRTYQLYQEIKRIVENSRRIRIQVRGSNWGLGCNSIHFLDLIAFLTNENNFELQNSQLDKEIINSKRPGFIEFTGSIIGNTLNNRVQFEFSSFNYGSMPLKIMIDSELARIWIKESTGETIFSIRENQWVNRDKEYKIPKQSEMTHSIIEQIISYEECNLPTFQESSHLHKLLLQTFLNHLNENCNDEVNECLIT
ncbi:oxidoreductase family protein [Bacillus oleivorans]|uniref:Oxidoreductase family protein n=1 Tax=Bacillus oleivorans TaxID=1448271 RepID=A0A285CZA9_9BACI|nr:Gfo/Idh/MocA family oxidoreductase [Bacillus oleivorans]SNX72880.1 oxidoreductase family protein [Bacillus oleivorans]